MSKCWTEFLEGLHFGLIWIVRRNHLVDYIIGREKCSHSAVSNDRTHQGRQKRRGMGGGRTNPQILAVPLHLAPLDFWVPCCNSHPQIFLPSDIPAHGCSDRLLRTNTHEATHWTGRRTRGSKSAYEAKMRTVTTTKLTIKCPMSYEIGISFKVSFASNTHTLSCKSILSIYLIKYLIWLKNIYAN